MVNSDNKSLLLLWTLGAVGCLALAAHAVSGQEAGSAAGVRARRQLGQMDSQTFLHFLTHTPESLCGGSDGSGGKASLSTNPRIRSYCHGASVADRLVHQGLVNGYKICQTMFQNERWNCTFAHQFLETGYPHAGFVWAMTVSKAVEELVMACRRGEPGLACECHYPDREKQQRRKNRKRKQRPKRAAAVETSATEQPEQLKMLSPESIGQKYGSMNMPTCNDNIGLASRRVREFFADIRPPSEGVVDMHQAIKFHNRRAGHIVVRQSQVKICHCLGISGSCTKQMCIKGLRRHSGKVEASMHALFQASKLVQLESAARQQQRSRRSQALIWRDPRSGRNRRVSKKFLVYSSEPPDFCSGSQALGYFGVQGRQCNSSSSAEVQPERGSCSHLCCGRFNFEAAYRMRQEWCNCQMVYNPIRVDCQMCERRILLHKCRLYQPYPEP